MTSRTAVVRTFTAVLSSVAVAMLAGCVQAPPRPEAVVATPAAPVAEAAGAGESAARSDDPVPELTLNLPRERTPNCPCTDSGELDRTFLERGYDALAANQYIEAVQYFQRYQRMEVSAEAGWEAGVAVAYVSLMPSSPFFDPEAARKGLGKLDKLLKPGMQVHSTSLMMRESIDALLSLERQTRELEAANVSLREELEKREEALKRLRELTLGQRGARP